MTTGTAGAPAQTVAELVAARAADHSPALLTGQRCWSWAEHTVEAARRAEWYAGHHASGPPHVGVLLDNVAEFSFWLAAAALGRFVVVGLNPTRADPDLAADVRATACDTVVTDAAGAARLSGLDLAGASLLSPDTALPSDDCLQGVLARARDAEPDDLYLLIFTSGTTGTPKAVRCSQRKIALSAYGIIARVGLTRDDVSYVSMPLFHSNAVITGWAPSLAAGAAIALRPRFSASNFLPDIRRYGATYANYVGTPLSYVLAQPERPNDADNPLQRVFGNEGAPADLERFATRFACRVLDGFGSSEGGISISRTPDTPPGALGRGVGDVRVCSPETGAVCPPAVFDSSGRLLNAAAAVGELVGFDGPGLFEGYWEAPEENAQRVRDGRYHSGDLGYADSDGFLYFAGRLGDRLRVGGENLSAAPIARLIGRHPQVIEAVVYAVPDPVAGDAVMAAVVPAEGFDPAQLAGWMAGQPDASPRWLPRFVRVAADLPRTATGKVLVRRLAEQAWEADGDPVWVRDDGLALRPFTAADAVELDRAFAGTGRQRIPAGTH